MAARQSAYWTEHLPALVTWANAEYAAGRTPAWDRWATDNGATSGNAVRMKYTEHCLRTGQQPERPPLHQPPVPAERGDVLRDWLDTMAPVELRLPPRPRRPGKPGNTTAVGGDFQFPAHDLAACAAFLDAIRYTRADPVILNGDTVDMLAVSRFPKDLRHSWTLEQERRAYHEFLAELFDVVAEWNGTVVETNANHSGNGVEGRWMRYLSERLGELASMPDIAEALSYERVWFPRVKGEPDPRIRLVDHADVADGLIALHGDIARKKAAYSAAGMLDKWRHSLIHNHTHRMGMTGYRVPAVGQRGEGVLVAYEAGCLCQLNPSYASAPDWVQGFVLVRHTADRRDWGVEPVRLSGGRGVIGGAPVTVGGADRAAA